MKAQRTDGLFLGGGNCPLGYLFLIPFNISWVWNIEDTWLKLLVKKFNFICIFLCDHKMLINSQIKIKNKVYYTTF